ncbi:MAG TPA: EAL domain-containing protein [Oxalicibacterium sp.]|nr:EAL domain-containing protein [Oxalicibacterium sp.]
MLKILLVEDTQTDAELTLRELTRSGIRHKGLRVETEQELRTELSNFGPDIVLSDFSMPHFDGLSALKVVREVKPDTPFIFVSGRIGEELAIESLKMGANDYVIKTNLSRLPSAVMSAMERVEQREARRRVEMELQRSNRMFRTFMDNLSGVAFIKDVDGRFIFANHGLDKVLNVDAGASIGKLDTELMPEEAARTLRALDAQVLVAGTPMQGVDKIPTPAGDTYWLSTRFPLADSVNSVRHVGGISINITELMKVQQDLALRNRAIEASANPIVIVDASAENQPLIYVNSAFEAITGYTSEEAVGRNCNFLQRSDYDQPELEKLRDAIRERRSVSVLLRNYRKDGSLFLNQLYIAPVTDEQHDEVRYFVGVLYDVTQIRRYQEDLERQANYDALTGLANRNLLHERTQQALSQARRYGHLLTVVFIDIDNFKLVNDSMGHSAGDELIVTVAERLRVCVRDGDTVARIGGDEFVLVLVNQNFEDANLQIMKRIQDEMAQPVLIRGQALVVTCSMGLARFPEDGADCESLLANADVAMYRAKSRGRNNFQFYAKEMNAKAGDRLSLESDLWHALENNELTLNYQPQIDMRSGRIIGMEALIRWNHPKRGLIPPMEFIPAAECNGLIIPIGRWVLETACRQSLQLVSEGFAPMRVAVNLSARQLSQRGFVESVHEVISSTGIDPEYLELEVTESMVMQNVDEAVGILGRLNEMGVQLSLDDFGTGFSSLAYLKRFPIDRLKIDQSFIRHCDKDRDDAIISQTIIALAHGLKIKVIAEGVETAAHLNFLKENNCDEGQGYFISRPLPFEQLRALLAQQPAY